MSERDAPPSFYQLSMPPTPPRVAPGEKKLPSWVTAAASVVEGSDVKESVRTSRKWLAAKSELMKQQQDDKRTTELFNRYCREEDELTERRGAEADDSSVEQAAFAAALSRARVSELQQGFASRPADEQEEYRRERKLFISRMDEVRALRKKATKKVKGKKGKAAAASETGDDKADDAKGAASHLRNSMDWVRRKSLSSMFPPTARSSEIDAGDDDDTDEGTSTTDEGVGGVHNNVRRHLERASTRTRRGSDLAKALTSVIQPTKTSGRRKSRVSREGSDTLAHDDLPAEGGRKRRDSMLSRVLGGGGSAIRRGSVRLPAIGSNMRAVVAR